jgi:sugar-specific transcriptional regulator TrmB/DNA-binding CsgD family transcriptional regulator
MRAKGEDSVDLSVIGVDATQEQVYRALVANPDATTAVLAGRLGLPEITVAVALEAIAGRGLAARSAASPDRYVPAPPAVALGAIVTQYRDDLRRVDVALAELAEEYRQASETRSLQDVIEVITGVEAIRHRFDQVQRGAVEEVLAFVAGPPIAVTYAENAARCRARERGVVYRRVIDRSEFDAGGLIAELIAELPAEFRRREEIRVMESLPTKLVIADRSKALVALQTVGVPSAVLVHSSGLLDGLLALFDTTWRAAMPVRLSVDGAAEGVPQPDVEPGDAKILGLLLAGFTDQAVAGHLGTSVRTVQRRVKHLMDVAGVQTRMQLGWYAARQGWV